MSRAENKQNRNLRRLADALHLMSLGWKRIAPGQWRHELFSQTFVKWQALQLSKNLPPQPQEKK
jgi:hypothetical protein